MLRLGSTLSDKQRWFPFLVILLVIQACSFPTSQAGVPEPTPEPAEPTSTLGASAPTPTGPTGSVPRAIFHNGTILTMVEAEPLAQAIAVEGKHIVAVGHNQDILALQTPDTRVIDLQGRTLMPGFVDAHNHLFGSPANPGQEVLSSYESGGLHVDADAMEANQAVAIQYGITAAGEMAVDETLAEKMIALDEAGRLQIRTNMYLMANDACGTPKGDWYRAYPAGHEYSDKLRVGGIKIFADGGSCNVPAVSFEFPDGLGQGDLYHTQDELDQMVAELQADGYQVAIHAAGDRSLEQVQNTYATVLNGLSNTYRHRIEHNAVINPNSMARYNEIGIVAVIFGLFPTCFKTRDFALKFDVPAAYQTWEWPWRDLLDANPGLHVGWHSDWPVTTLDTMQQLHGFVTRRQMSDDGSFCEPTPDIASGIITIEEALRIMTIGSAYALSRDATVGSLEPGKLADLIILSDNPLAVMPDDLLNIKVQMTMIDGLAVYCAEGQEALCPQQAPAVPTDSPSPTPAAAPAPTSPPVAGSEPSYRVAAFYYPWYRTLEFDGYWDHWGEANFDPPLDIASDYFPLLGLYSNVDPVVVAQHFAWLREAGVGVIISSWWGRTSIEDQAVPVVLEMGERYGIKVAFHIEPYGGRTAEQLVSDIWYLYDRYGAHPAFYRTTASSRWSPDDRAKGLFFLWSARFPDHETPEVEASYWREAVDAVHALPDGGLILADETVTHWVDSGHFDGLYSYAALRLDEGNAYSWARGLPPDAWYVPGVNPGFSARRIGYADDTYVPRRDGTSYEQRWQAALDVGVEPDLVAVTTFNEWHEGTQIEPAAVGVTNGLGYTYEDYGLLPPDGYLTLTRQWVDRFLATTWPESQRVRFRLVTTSDWTTFGLVGGATWLRPSVVSASEEADYAGPEGPRFLLTQPLARAEAGGTVEMIVDILLTDTEGAKALVFEIERGHLGSTQVELANFQGAETVVVQTFVWDEIAPGERNARTFRIPLDTLLKSAP